MRLYAVPGGLVNVKRSYNESKFFRFTVQTTASPETFALPLEAGGTYDFLVDWGDDSSDNITVWNAAAVTHTYANAGTHTVSISGIVQGWRFNNAGDKLKIYDIKSWGSLRLGNSSGCFYGCSNLTVSAVDVLDLTNTTILSRTFRDCSSLITFNVNGWDTSSVTSFYQAFNGCSSLTTLDVSNWDTSSATSFQATFSGCSSLTALNVSNWDTSSVTSFHTTFYNCSSLTVLDVNSWNVASVTMLAYTFAGCSSLATLNVSSWNTSAITTVENTFHGCALLTTLALDNWNIASVTTATSLLLSVTLTTVTYDALILSWSPQAQTIVANFHGGNSKYTGGGAVEAARDAWIAKGWTITDGGIAP